MKWNMNSRKLLADLSAEDAWRIIKDPREEVPDVLHPQWDDFHAKAIEAAIKYAAVNLMLSWTNLINLFFPESIRCTVHPKKGQVALAGNYPWNGVAWSEKWPKGFHNIKTEPFYKLGKYTDIKKVVLKGFNYPCFYTTGLHNQNLDAAKLVLPATGWNYEDFFGRELSIYDMDIFAQMGQDDPYFNWLRTVQPKEYYTSLLQFRIAHYKKYGFGVHAVFWKGEFIGQLGLQVYAEKNDQIEFVIFLGKEYVNKGLGTKLLRYLFSRCKEEGICTLVGVIRNENEVAQKCIKKFNAKQIRTVTHYQKNGILYEINL